ARPRSSPGSGSGVADSRTEELSAFVEQSLLLMSMPLWPSALAVACEDVPNTHGLRIFERPMWLNQDVERPRCQRYFRICNGCLSGIKGYWHFAEFRTQAFPQSYSACRRLA